MNGNKKIKELKKKFLEYYAEVPMKKYAAASVGRDEDTCRTWEKDDSAFADQITRLRAAYLKHTLKGVRSKEWLVEKMFREFIPTSKTVNEHTFVDKSDLDKTFEETKDDFNSK